MLIGNRVKKIGTLNYVGVITRTSRNGTKNERRVKRKKVINQFRNFKLKLTRTKRVDQKEEAILLGLKIFRVYCISLLTQRLQAVFRGIETKPLQKLKAVGVRIEHT